jgi:hypothetical protein
LRKLAAHPAQPSGAAESADGDLAAGEGPSVGSTL